VCHSPQIVFDVPQATVVRIRLGVKNITALPARRNHKAPIALRSVFLEKLYCWSEFIVAEPLP
jgi:hypothetical protein